MYILIHEDMTIQQTAKTPDSDTLESIDAGILSVLRVSVSGEIEDLQADNSWIGLPIV